MERSREQFEKLVTEYVPYCWAIVRKFRFDDATSHDVLQNAFMKAWNSFSELRGLNQKSSLIWFGRIVQRECGAYLRAKAKLPTEEPLNEKLVSSQTSIEQMSGLWHSDAAQASLQAIATYLTPPQKNILFTIAALELPFNTSVNERLDLTAKASGYTFRTAEKHYGKIKKTVEWLYSDSWKSFVAMWEKCARYNDINTMRLEDLANTEVEKSIASRCGDSLWNASQLRNLFIKDLYTKKDIELNQKTKLPAFRLLLKEIYASETAKTNFNRAVSEVYEKYTSHGAVDHKAYGHIMTTNTEGYGVPTGTILDKNTDECINLECRILEDLASRIWRIEIREAKKAANILDVIA